MPAPRTLKMDCPVCGGNRWWDNRENKNSPRSPDFKCADRNCGDVAVWMGKRDGLPELTAKTRSGDQEWKRNQKDEDWVMTKGDAPSDTGGDPMGLGLDDKKKQPAPQQRQQAARTEAGLSHHGIPASMILSYAKDVVAAVAMQVEPLKEDEFNEAVNNACDAVSSTYAYLVGVLDGDAMAQKTPDAQSEADPEDAGREQNPDGEGGDATEEKEEGDGEPDDIPF